MTLQDELLTIHRRNLKHDILSKKEIYRLISICQSPIKCPDDQTKKKHAVDRIVNHNMKLIERVANKHTPRNFSIINKWDLISEGAEGLIHAIGLFDLSKDFEFSTYALPWIEQKIRRCVMNHSNTIRIPIHIYQEGFKIKKFLEKCDKQGIEYPPDNELVEMFNISEQTLDTIKKSVINNNVRSLDQCLFDSDDSLNDLLPNKEIDLLTQAITKEQKEYIDTILTDCLSPREATIIKMRYGLGHFDKKGYKTEKAFTLEQIANRFGLTRERIRQIESHSLKKLKKCINENYK